MILAMPISSIDFMDRIILITVHTITMTFIMVMAVGQISTGASPLALVGVILIMVGAIHITVMVGDTHTILTMAVVIQAMVMEITTQVADIIMMTFRFHKEEQPT